MAGSNQTEGVESIVGKVLEFANFSSGNNTLGGRRVFEQFGQFELKLPNYFVREVSSKITVIVEGAVRCRNLIIDVQPILKTTDVPSEDVMTMHAALLISSATSRAMLEVTSEESNCELSGNW